MSLPKTDIPISQDNKSRNISFPESNLFTFQYNKDRDVTFLEQICMTFQGNNDNMTLLCKKNRIGNTHYMRAS